MHRNRIYVRLQTVIVLILAIIAISGTPGAAAPKKLDKPPLGERWFGIYMDNERVGFYHEKITEVPEGYRVEGDGTVRMKVMGFSKDSSSKETYLVGRNLAMKTFEVEQVNNGMLSRLKGRVTDTSLTINEETGGKQNSRILRIKSDIYPGPVLNLYPLMRDPSAGKTYKLLSFDAEEVRVREVAISVLGEEKAPDGTPAIKLRNNLFPMVHNDIWVGRDGNTLYESVRDGFVVTKPEDPKDIGAFIGSAAMARKDLIYDFSLVRADPPIADQKRLKGLAVEISGWNDSLPLLQDGGQTMEKAGSGKVTIRTGTAVQTLADAGAAADAYLAPAEKIESDAPEIKAKALEIAADKKGASEVAAALAAWTADWLKDTVDDGGGALASLKSRFGNCQTHSRLYTALARAAGIPTRFVSGLVYLEGKGFLYHSWAESRIDDRWIAVDPTYNQIPADPTHLKLFEGHTRDDLAPIIVVIGRIRITVLEAKYGEGQK